MNPETDIRYERDGVVKYANKRFKEALIEEGWTTASVNNAEKKDEISTPKRRGRPPKSEG